MEPMLDVSNLSFDYLSASSCLPVIDNISFQAFEGDFISIVGPSGCGKSTLLDIIAGLMPSSAGQVFFLGEPVIKPRKEIWLDFWFSNRHKLKQKLLRNKFSYFFVQKRNGHFRDHSFFRII